MCIMYTYNVYNGKFSSFLHHQQQQQCLKMDQVSTMCTWKKMNVSMNGNDDDDDSSLCACSWSSIDE